MEANMMGSFIIIIFMESVHLPGKMEENTLGNGKIIKWTEKVILHG
jgi:hypothetical protein